MGLAELFLFQKKIPLFSKLAANSTFTRAQETSIGLYRFNWAEVKVGHFLSDAAFVAIALLLLSLAMAYGRQFVRRDFGSMLARAGRVWGALWCGVAAICTMIAALDVIRLQISRWAAILWTATFALSGVALFALAVWSLRSPGANREAGRCSGIGIKVCGFVIATGCASLLHVVDFPPQTALGWVVVMLLMLGVPAGVGFLLPNREEVREREREPESELKGARYFGAWDLALFIPLCSMLIIGRWIIPELSQGNLMPLVQALLLAICLFNRVPESEVKQHPKSLFGNVLSAWIVLQFAMPLGFGPWCVSLPEPLPFTAYIENYLSLGFAALVVGLVLSVRVLPKGVRLERPWWKKARYWVLAGLAAFSFAGVELAPSFVTSKGAFTIATAYLLLAGAIGTLITLKRELRRTIRFILVGAGVLLSAGALVLSRTRGYAGIEDMLESSFGFCRYMVIAGLALFLIVLTLRRPAEAAARALRGRPARVAFYSLVIVLAFLSRSVQNFPLYPLGSFYYSSSGLTESDQRSLNTLPPESLPASRFLQQSTFNDIEGAHGSSAYAWAGIFAAPAKFPMLWEYVPRLMGQPCELVVGAARITAAANPSGVRLDVLYSRRLTGTGLSDLMALQLSPNRFRNQAAETLDRLKQMETWQAYFSYPRAIVETNAPCRSWDSPIEAVVDMAVFALSLPPGADALKLFWRLDGMPGAIIY
ncbi:MAG: hypothetical protein JW759_06475 [Candidatus Coatesbacteria bacterium]|nr:hypothetical protein [Candidatus Coatesbacteria bacterium]